MRYLIIIEKAKNNLSAYIPDIPGCITTGDTEEEIIENMQEALTGHLELMQQDGDSIPEPVSTSGYIEVNLPVSHKS
ncbi:MAG: HicB family protein [bacterium]|nr:MAG: HicB family protein [bacterium]